MYTVLEKASLNSLTLCPCREKAKTEGVGFFQGAGLSSIKPHLLASLTHPPCHSLGLMRRHHAWSWCISSVFNSV